jgi:hypothetical protein
LLALLIALWPACAAAGQLEEKPPAPETPPLHAAGGWPTDLTADTKKPGRTAEQQAQLDAVTHELARLARDFGPDSVVLQSKFLIGSMAAGAIGPTEVRVAGPSPSSDDHLEIDIETGLYFSGKTTTIQSRTDKVWNDVALPVLDGMKSFLIEPANLDLVFLFDVQDDALTPEALDPTVDSRHEAFHVKLSHATLADIAVDKVEGDAVRQQAELTPVTTVPRPGRPGQPASSTQ